jgi:hypothetical protein
MAKNGETKKGRSASTTWQQKAAMVNWLEAPGGKNFRWINGSAQSDLSSVVAGSKLRKVDAYNDLADFVNQRCGSNWNGQMAEARYCAYIKVYKEIKRKLSDPTGPKYTLTQQDIKKGNDTVEKKLESDCMYFTRLDNLFGDRQNVRPTFEMQSTSSRPPETGESKQSSVEEDCSSSETESDADVNALFAECAQMQQGQQSSSAYSQEISSAYSQEISSANAQVISSANSQEIQLTEEQDEEQEQQESSSRNSSKRVAMTTPTVNQKKKRLIPESASTMSSIASAINKKKDLAASYAEGKQSELAFKKERFAWEQKSREEQTTAETKRQVMLKLIEQKMSAEDIKNFMDTLFS